MDALPRRGRDKASIQQDFANHLKYDQVEDRYTSTSHDRYLALATSVRDRIVERWIETQQRHHDEDVKRVYYLSMEFLMGRALRTNLLNLGAEEAFREALGELGIDLDAIAEEEVDAGLGNGGLGRLAACFLDSLATLEIPAWGYGLRYDYGIFRQRIENGRQIEEPDDWLRGGNPWEVARTDNRVIVNFGGTVETTQDDGRLAFRWLPAQQIVGVPYDTPIVGYGVGTVNTLRLWSARATEEFHFGEFDQGDYVAAVEKKTNAETLTKVLYPNDVVYAGRELRLKQEYFFVACSLSDILRRFGKTELPWSSLPERAAIQMNDTHPALAVPELMRLLLDEHALGWEEAWDLTVRTLGYTNHTLLPEALETWPAEMMERLLPRHAQILYEINHRFLDHVRQAFPGDEERVAKVSLVSEGKQRSFRMAHAAIVGSHATNGVAALHSRLLRERLVPEFAAVYPERFRSVTNGVTPRRFLLASNPALAALLTEKLGTRWVRDLDALAGLRPAAEDPAFRLRIREIKRANKIRISNFLTKDVGVAADPDALFDVQIKRIHEYKRQLLAALRLVVDLERIRAGADPVPRVVLFGGKSAPGYALAKNIIELIGAISRAVAAEPKAKGKLAVAFLPDYRVSMAERVVPATDLSEQISTAGKEASGTGNMKFMMNGALTIGTLDGANVEIREACGAENFFLFGWTAEEVEASRGNYDPRAIAAADPEIAAALELIFSGKLGGDGFPMIRGALLDRGDEYRHLADFRPYLTAQAEVDRLYRDESEWSRKAVLNIAASGRFSSDRTIREYAAKIWDAKPHPILMARKRSDTILEARAPLFPEKPE